MTKTEIRQLIKEEIQKVLHESPIQERLLEKTYRSLIQNKDKVQHQLNSVTIEGEPGEDNVSTHVEIEIPSDGDAHEDLILEISLIHDISRSSGTYDTPGSEDYKFVGLKLESLDGEIVSTAGPTLTKVEEFLESLIH